MKNKYCYYTLSRIRQYTLSCIKKCLLSLYIFLYNDNKHFNYTSSHIIINKYDILYIFSYNTIYIFSCIKKCLLSLYILLCNYTFSCMKEILLVYEMMYNGNKYFLIYENVYRVIRDDV